MLDIVENPLPHVPHTIQGGPGDSFTGTLSTSISMGYPSSTPTAAPITINHVSIHKTLGDEAHGMRLPSTMHTQFLHVKLARTTNYHLSVALFPLGAPIQFDCPALQQENLKK